MRMRLVHKVFWDITPYPLVKFTGVSGGRDTLIFRVKKYKSSFRGLLDHGDEDTAKL
jgi:hypothetical protein